MLASFVFYGWWNPIYLLLILFSIVFNYFLGMRMGKNCSEGDNSNVVFSDGGTQILDVEREGCSSLTPSDTYGCNDNKFILIFGVVINLALLAYFKYANFFVDNLNAIIGSEFTLDKIILPLTISFFTFQQIAYLIDSYRGETKEYNFSHYCLFVSFSHS